MQAHPLHCSDRGREALFRRWDMTTRTQDLANANAAKLNMSTVPSLNLCYTEEEGYVTADVADEKKLTKKNLSGTKFRTMLRAGEDINPDPTMGVLVSVWLLFSSMACR